MIQRVKNKIIGIILISLMYLMLIGCQTIRVEAPIGPPVTLLTPDEKGEYTETHRAWYILFGLVSLNNNNTEKVIANADLKQIKVKEYYSFVDFLITGVLNILPTTIVTRTVIVEGNR